MDLQALANLFATTYNADPNIQKAGELQIRKVRRGPRSFVDSNLDSAQTVVDRCPRGHGGGYLANHCI